MPTTVSSTQAELREEVSDVCSLELEAEVISLRLEAVEVDGPQTLFASSDDGLGLVIDNAAPEAALVTIAAHAETELGNSEQTLEPVQVPAGSSVVTTVNLVDAGLPTESLNHSGSLNFNVRAELEGGGVVMGRTLYLFFHPEVGGFRVYDDEVRRTDFGDGALSVDAQETLASARALAPAGVRSGAAYVSSVTTEALDYQPEPDGPADDGGEQ